MAFSLTSADIAIFGGSAGPGKSRALVYEATRHKDVPGFTAAIFRRTSPELTGAGSVWEESKAIYPLCGATPREHRLDWRFPSGALVQFCHCQYEQDLQNHQSKAYCYIALDEMTQFTERQFWFLLSRNRSTCGVKPYFRGATNPDANSFVRDLIAWWIDEDGYPIPERSGVIRWLARVNEEIVWADTKEELQKKIDELVVGDAKPQPYSFTFIAAKLEDNPTMAEKDPGYAARLHLLQRVDRLRMLGGNWNIREAAGEMFRGDWYEIVDEAPADVIRRVRFWDKAATDSKKATKKTSWTVGVLMSVTRCGLYFVEHVVRLQGSPLAVEQAIKNTALIDGKHVTVGIWQDPGQAGKADVDNYVRLLTGWTVRGIAAREDKITYAKPVSAQAERGNIKLVRGRWNKQYLYEHENFPEIDDKDQVDATSGAFLMLTKKKVYDLGAPQMGEPTGRKWDA